MKKFTLIIFVFICNLGFANKDSLKFANYRGFYINSYYPYQLSSSYHDDGKYPNDYYYEFNTKPYRFQTPGIGLGYVINKNGWFIKTDFNYWYAFKHLHDDFYFKAGEKDSRNTYSSFPSFEPSPVGTRYYQIKDRIEGSLRLHYFDIGFAVTGNITRFLRIYSGWRINYLLDYSYKAEIKREAALYEITGYSAPYWPTVKLIDVEYLTYTDKEAENKLNQEITGNVLSNLGVNANFKLGKRLFFADLLLEFTPILISRNGTKTGCITFKLAYVFNYSTKFKDKKHKD